MIRLSLAAAASVLVLAACATAPEAPVDTAGSVSAAAEVSTFDLAMQTVEDLVAAGNTQTAVDRLTQLLGDPSLSRDELAAALYRRAELRLSDMGFDTMGAIEDLEELTTDFADTEWNTAAVGLLETARGKADSLHFQMEQPETTRSAAFSVLMDLGMHEEAIDLMLANDITPDNDTLVAMYQIGYLCEGDDLTGRAYDLTEPDGTSRSVRFCDFGK
ncbi:MAG: hypothetical protein VKJ09_15790 [Leptolyngbya sp.]|nr:hypothetical protein [Leptolyngbya sp.]